MSTCPYPDGCTTVVTTTVSRLHALPNTGAGPGTVTAIWLALGFIAVAIVLFVIVARWVND